MKKSIVHYKRAIVAWCSFNHTSPVHPEPFATERRYRVHAPVQEHSEFRLVVPRGQRSGVQTGPVGFVPPNVRCCRGGAPDGNPSERYDGDRPEMRHFLCTRGATVYRSIVTRAPYYYLYVARPRSVWGISDAPPTHVCHLAVRIQRLVGSRAVHDTNTTLLGNNIITLQYYTLTCDGFADICIYTIISYISIIYFIKIHIEFEEKKNSRSLYLYEVDL